MKKRTFLAITIATVFTATMVSCGSDSAKDESNTAQTTAKEEAMPTIDGGKLFADNGCVVCHQLEIKTVGPSVKGIKAVYGGNAEGLAGFLNGETEAIVDPAQAAVMKPQVEVTKGMTAEERAAIASYLLR